MHVITRKRLREFWEVHGASEEVLRRWYKVVEASRWRHWADLRATFQHADPVKGASGTTLAVFNVGGNSFRIVARVMFEYGRVYIKKVMTHAEYSRGRWKEEV